MQKANPPKNVSSLLNNCQNITGMSIKQLALATKTPMPKNLSIFKGWLGELLEICLGADAKNLPVPDFQELGIELKTIPLTKNFTPAESTYVCTAPINNLELNWNDSRVKKKLSHVLWVPFEASKDIPLENRKILQPLLWKPNTEQEAILKSDWEELTDMLRFGMAEQLSARFGKYLQIRPKAANSRAMINTINEYGEPIKIVPKGFYLRASFTKEILQQNFI